jgi:uridine kinase
MLNLNWAEILYERMKRICPGIEELEPYEFRYCLDNWLPLEAEQSGTALPPREELERLVNSRELYAGIQIKLQVGYRIVLDEAIVRLNKMLFVGLATGEYSEEWVSTHFTFDIRGFYFLHRTAYFTDKVVAHLGGRPFVSFEQKQRLLEKCQEIGYKAFREANAEVDQAFLSAVHRLITVRGTPIVVAIAGPTAAGKTEIVARLRSELERSGRQVASIEMDNFLTDRDQREERGIYSFGRKAIHLELFLHSLRETSQGRRISTPRYDFVHATSSHDLDGRLKPGCHSVEIEPADVLFLEGNMPFLLEEVAPLIGLRVVYLTDDAIRMKRKWRRDIDYRKKYEPTYFRNRFFREQFLMAQQCYVPQMEVCDMVVHTTGAALWTTPEIARVLSGTPGQRE